MVLHHDATTKKLAGVDRKVAEQTYAELRKLDVGAWKGAKWKGIRIPKLDAVLATMLESRGLQLSRCQRPFRPEGGAYAGHQHG